MEGAIEKPKAAQAGASADSGGLMLRGIKFVLALAALPLCLGMALGLYDYFMTYWSHSSDSDAGLRLLLKWFGIGGLLFSVVAVLFWRPVVIYVFGHELMHALATWMCLGKVSNLKASARGGQVTTSKSNTLIRLAPYCFPLYAVLVVALYAGINAYRPISAYMHWAACAIGFFYAFHIGFTFWSLHHDQPDLKPDGWLFSMVVIFLSNIAVAALMLGFLFGGHVKFAWPALHETSLSGWRHSQTYYRQIAETVKRSVSRFTPRKAEIEAPAVGE